MADIRNQDQIVFIEPGRGVLANRTLGAEVDFSTLRGQHNPDYIPESRGGPAVLVADSHNDRAVEYQLRDDASSETPRADGSAVNETWCEPGSGRTLAPGGLETPIACRAAIP